MKLFGFWDKMVENHFEKQYGVFDIDNNNYSQIKIGNKIWMADNLNVCRFRNGDLIKEAKSDQDWINSYYKMEPAWCYFENDSTNRLYGKLYNVYAIKDSRGLAPKNYHIPSDNEWDEVINHMGGSDKVFDDLRLLFKFNCHFGGSRGPDGSFKFIDYVGAFWTSSKVLNSDELQWIKVFHLPLKIVKRSDKSKMAGAYVKCVKDY